MKGIPKSIEDRIIWDDKYDLTRIKSIRPVDPCDDCQRPLSKIRVIKTSWNLYPFPHQRTVCENCKSICHTGSGEWYKTAVELNRVIREADYPNKTPVCKKQDK